MVSITLTYKYVYLYFGVSHFSNFNIHTFIFLSQYYEISKEMLIELSNDSGILKLWIRHVQITRTFQFSDNLAANIQLLYEASHLNYTTVPSTISYFIQKELIKTNLCRSIECASANCITYGSGDNHENGSAHDVKVLGYCPAMSRHGSAVKSIACPAHGCSVRGNAWTVSAHRHYGSKAIFNPPLPSIWGIPSVGSVFSK